MLRALSVLALSALSSVYAQDPAEGWMGYAAGTNPGGGKILYMEAKWKVGSNPTPSFAFFSPWFGIESSDNLNLIQPVNPWDGSSWSIYNEYFQWSPENNINSASHTVKQGDVLFGSVTYVAANNSYTVYHSDLNDGWSVTSSIQIQKSSSGQPKIFNIAYIVYEKVWECNLYPKDGAVEFYDISIKWDGPSQNTTWVTGIVDDNCNNRATIVDESTVRITWDTTLQGGKGQVQGTVTGLHSDIYTSSSSSKKSVCSPRQVFDLDSDSDSTDCPAGQTTCAYLPGKTQCCLAGENCIPNVGCRC